MREREMYGEKTCSRRKRYLLYHHNRNIHTNMLVTLPRSKLEHRYLHKKRTFRLQSSSRMVLWNWTRKKLEFKTWQTFLMSSSPFQHLEEQGPLKSSLVKMDSIIEENPDMDNLGKQCITVVEWCCMCKRIGETVDHLLLHREVARALWDDLFNTVGL